MGFPHPRCHGIVYHHDELGTSLLSHTEVVPIAEILFGLSADRRRVGNGGIVLLRIPADETELPHRTLDLAHGDGAEFVVPVAQPEVVHSGQLIFNGLQGVLRQLDAKQPATEQ